MNNKKINFPKKMTPISLAVRASLFGLSLACGSAQAENIVVTSTLDDNDVGCTLREAIASANTADDQGNGCALGSDSGTDTISFASNVFSSGNNIITLANGELVLSNKDLVLNASAISGGVVIDANRASRVMSVTGGSFFLDSLTITGGSTPLSSDIYVSNGAGLAIGGGASVTLSNALVNDNRAAREGGGIRIFDTATHVTINDSVISNNFAGKSTTGRGGGVSLLRGKLEVSSSEISDNTVSGSTSTGGSGIHAYGGEFSLYNTTVSRNGGSYAIQSSGSTVLIVDSEVSDNVSPGINIDNRNNNTASIIRGSTISNNSSNVTAGLIFLGNQANIGAQLIVEDTTISHNQTTLRAGNNTQQGSAVRVYGGRVDFRNSTISNNLARLSVINVEENGSAYFDNVTIADNQIDGFDNPELFPALPTMAVFVGNLNSDGKVNFKNSIISNPAFAQDCLTVQESPFTNNTGEVTIDSATIVRDGSCGALRSGDPSLLPLADNTGPSKTQGLAADSIAINTGDPATCLATDQRDLSRDASCDVGAFEFGVIVPTLSVTVLPLGIAENGGIGTGTVTRSNTSLDQALTVELLSEDVSSATVPNTVVIPAGEASAAFAINAVDDLIADGDKAVLINASSTGLREDIGLINIIDNEVAALDLVLPFDTVTEGIGSFTATLSRNTPSENALTVALSSSNTERVTVPESVTFEAGQTSTTFEVRVLDDFVPDNSTSITIAASVSGLQNSSANVDVIDNDTITVVFPTLSISVPSNSVAEDSGIITATITSNVFINEPLTVVLSSSNPDSITVPASVLFDAGVASATFDITVIDDLIINGDSISTISATADSFDDGTTNITVIDNDDIDGDDIANAIDNCPADENSDQADLDGDLVGDVCDTDIDGDGFSNEAEVTFGSDPTIADLDDNNNGIPDSAEASKNIDMTPIILFLLQGE